MILTTVALIFGMGVGKFFSISSAGPVDASAGRPARSVQADTPASSVGESGSGPAVLHRPTISTREFDRMTAEMRRQITRFRGKVCVYVKNLETDQEWAYNANVKVPSASLIKIPVMIGVYEKIGRGELSLDQRVTLNRSARKAGSGQLKWRNNGEQFTIRELLEEMITVSDNIAQEMLIQTVGMEYLQRQFSASGLIHTNLTRQGLTLRPYTSVENFTTAREMGMILEDLYRCRKMDPRLCQEMLGIMQRVKYKDRLPRYMPKDYGLSHKTGLLRRACHDVGIVYSPAGDYIICVLTANGPSYRDSKRFIAKVGSISYRYFQTPSPLSTASTLRPATTFKPAS